MAPKDVHDLIPKTCGSYFIWKKIFAYVIKLRIFRWREHSALCGWAPNAITNVLIMGRQKEV